MIKHSLTSFLLAGLLLLAGGCVRETDAPLEQEVRYAPVPVRVDGEPDDPATTRSLIPLSAEDFRNAALFAFGDDGHLLTYQYLEGRHPVAVEVTRKDFEWILPMDTPMDIYVLVNYTSLKDLGLSVENPDLLKSDLENLFYRCETVEAFTRLGESRIPMAGKVRQTLSGEDDALRISVRRLFARYDITLDASSFREKGYTLTSGYLRARNCNTAVPWFGEGYRFTPDSPGSLVSSMDSLTDSQLLTLLDPSLPASQRTAILYVPENCQGDLGTASSWEQVYYELGAGKMQYATYAEIYLTASRDGETRDFIYRIYLGRTDQQSNFDVPRNFHKTLNLTLRPILPETAGERPGAAPFDGFLFLYDQAIVQESGKWVDLPFETNLTKEEIRVSIPASEQDYLSVPDDFLMEYGVNRTRNTRYAYGGTIRLFAPDKSSNVLDRYVSVSAGVPGEPAFSDETLVHVRHTRWITIDVTHDWGQGEYVFTATEPVPCRVDMQVYSGDSVSPSYMYLARGVSTVSYAMPPDGNPEIRALRLYKLDGKLVPPMVYTNTNTEYHFILSIEGDNFEVDTPD